MIRDLARLIELNKKLAELEFRKTILGVEEDSQMIAKHARELKAKTSNVELIYPHQERLDILAKELATHAPEQIKESVKSKSGEPYKILIERGELVKRNYQNRSEIAKLCYVVSKLPNAEKSAISDFIKTGKLEAPVQITPLNDKQHVLARILNRCGLACEVTDGGLVAVESPTSVEHRIDISNRGVWVGPESYGKLQENLKKMETVNAQIQLKNAERQIKNFNHDEEEYFAVLQREYLGLLKQQDELLKDYYAEDSLN